MKIETTRFGAIDVPEDAVVTFTQPIVGFPGYRRFTLLPGPADSGLRWLQSTEDGELAFLLMNPENVLPEYTVELRKAELRELAVEGMADLDVYTLVVAPADRSQIRTNLRAPILINREQRLGKQTILDNTDYPVRFYLAQRAPAREGEPSTASGGRPC